MYLPNEIINKILLYNIHPIAKILKVLINDYDTKCTCCQSSFYEYIIDNYPSCYTCFYCNKKLCLDGSCYCINRFNFCKDCNYKTDPNDDIYDMSPYEYLEYRLIEKKL